MSTFALVVIGVGACIGVVTSLLLRPQEPATWNAPPVRAPSQPRSRRPEPGGPARGVAPAAGGEAPVLVPSGPAPAEPHAGETREPSATFGRTRPAGPPRPPEGEPNLPTPWWRRLAAAGQLAAIAVTLGVLVAAALGVMVIALIWVLRGTVG